VIATVMTFNDQLQLCTPVEVTGGQAALMVVKYLEEHPERLHEDGAALVVETLGRTPGPARSRNDASLSAFQHPGI